MRQTIRGYSIVSSFLQLYIFYVACFTSTHVSGQERKEYIVYMGNSKSTDIQHKLHLSFLQKAIGINSSASVLYSYKGHINGFVALLTDEESERISSMEEEVLVFPNKNHHLQTTRSWDFLNFTHRIQRAHTVESDIIVGILDTGIWPESNCFSDTGFGYPPNKWQGSCDHGLTNFHCNRKLIGAKYYKNNGRFSRNDIQSPRDSEGHGTHVASLIACNFVNSEGLSGLGRGIVRGGVPSSRISVYKVCWSNGCADEDIFEAFSDAIRDGVDIISISFGGASSNYYKDSVAFMSFQAMNKGILTTMAAGNNGPKLKSIENNAPWGLTVAASASDRNYVTNLMLGNGTTLKGVSVNTFHPNDFIPIVYGGDVPNKRKGASSSKSRRTSENRGNRERKNARYCLSTKSTNNTRHLSELVFTECPEGIYEHYIYKTFPIACESIFRYMDDAVFICVILCKMNSLDPKLVMGKIVVCDEFNLGEAALSAGAAGMVIRINATIDNSDTFPLPTTYLDMPSGYNLMRYLHSSSNPIGSILKSTENFDASAPYIASFSSRGPNHITPHILKPDLCAPGVKILGAWTLASSLTGFKNDLRSLPYNIVSGTSSACPHVTAAAAYVKSFHPSWSPAAIKSALMTTAFMMSDEKTPEAEFGYGAGQIIPERARNPGLVYDATLVDYVKFLCGQGYSNSKLKFLSGVHKACDRYGTDTAWNLNMPSFSIPVRPSTSFNVTYFRTVTNVGPSSSIYHAQIVAPPGLNIQVVPHILSFSSVGQTQKFRVVFMGRINRGTMVSASLFWVSATNKVRSPIVAFTV